MMAKSSELSPTIDSTAPTGSRAAGLASVESGAMNTMARKATTAMGTATKNTDPYQ